jgi:pimeloyl-ACP methyl ester carboxylesterase
MAKTLPSDRGEELETVTSADGTPIAFERSGSGPPLVLVHGMAGNHARWELFDVRARLAERTTVYAMDRRGHGESGDIGEYALEREFEDVAAVVDSIDEPVHLLGHSHGGLCALEAALRTDNVASLIVYEPAGPWEEGHLYSEETYQELETLVADSENERALLVFLREVVDLPDSQIDDLRAAPNWSARVAEAPTLPREYRAPATYEFEPERFTDTTVPAVLLVGGESPQWIRDVTDDLNDALPNSRISVLEGQGHVAMNTAPDLFIDEVLAFVQEHQDRC